ncbi:uncharacterized protein [Watersipora subatra]|uniref:uncharacterized protein n=1 Tax=Watersipora subatra TaxID=2589382 RepID=UPI00355C35F1
MHIITIIIAFLTVLETSMASKMKTASHCNHETFIYLRCPTDSLIRIYNVTYGRSDNNACFFNQGDCSLTEPTSLGCNGRSSCDISIRGDTRYYITLPKCGVTGNYIEIKYECVKVDEIADICAEERNDRSSLRGYAAIPTISTGEYSANLDCQYRIVGTNIRMQLITVNLTDSNDCIQIHNMLRAKNYCGGGEVVVENTNIAPAPTNQVTITFVSGDVGHHGSVWIYYELNLIPTSAPLPRQTAPPPLLPTTLPDVVISQVGTPTKRTIYPKPTSSMPKSLTSHLGRLQVLEGTTTVADSSTIPSSTLAILGLVFGLFALILMMLFGVYCYKRYKDCNKKRVRLRTSSGLASNQVAWHNLTNECLADITKSETMDTNVQNNNIIPKVHNSCATTKNCPVIEQSLC